MQQSVPCESARQLLDVVLKHEVILAVATALCSGSSDCTHPSSDGALPNKYQSHTNTYKKSITQECTSAYTYLEEKEKRRGREEEGE